MFSRHGLSSLQFYLLNKCVGNIQDYKILFFLSVVHPSRNKKTDITMEQLFFYIVLYTPHSAESVNSKPEGPNDFKSQKHPALMTMLSRMKNSVC